MTQEKQRFSTAKKIGIVVVCAILALAMTIPSMAVLLANDTQSTSDTTSTESVVPDENTSVEDTNSYYQNLVTKLETSISDGSASTTAYKQLGDDYYAWANALSAYHSDDADAQTQAVTCWQKAKESYEKYLADNDSASVRVSDGVATYFSGDTAGGLAILEQTTVDYESYVPAWFNLGLLYLYSGDTDNAQAALQKVLDLDPDDQYGYQSTVKSLMGDSSDTSDATSDATTSEEASDASTSDATSDATTSEAAAE
jgi:tetratricopeptide (TPR) repeat protein